MTETASALWINSTFAGFDAAITTAIHHLYEIGGGFFTPFFEFISLLGKGGAFLILLSLLLTFYRPTRRFGTAMCLGLALGALVTNCCLKVLIARARPYADESSIYYQFWQLVGMHTESDKSFPSGHTTAAFGACVSVFLIGKKRISWTALLFGLAMAVARIYLCVHYPSDVLAGFLVGTLAGCCAVIIASHLPAKWYEMDFTKQKKGAHECSAGEK
jgi:undecaprenyl-diphosphatase